MGSREIEPNDMAPVANPGDRAPRDAPDLVANGCAERITVRSTAASAPGATWGGALLGADEFASRPRR